MPHNIFCSRKKAKKTSLTKKICLILLQSQKDLGAAKTSAYYSIAPFLGVAFSMAIVGERPDLRFYIALLIMIAGTVIMTIDTVRPEHK